MWIALASDGATHADDDGEVDERGVQARCIKPVVVNINIESSRDSLKLISGIEKLKMVNAHHKEQGRVVP